MFHFLSYEGLEAYDAKIKELIGDSYGDVMTTLATLMAYLGYQADSTDTTPTPTEVIDISKQAYADAFGNDLPSGFVMPNSCTVDGTTYYGTVNS